jgi:hypothetical protein
MWLRVRIAGLRLALAPCDANDSRTSLGRIITNHRSPDHQDLHGYTPDLSFRLPVDRLPLRRLTESMLT